MVTTQPSVINASNNEVALPKATGYGRGARDAANDPCDDFRIGNKHKREFYSPNWPNNYPNQTNCVKVLEGTTFDQIIIDLLLLSTLSVSHSHRQMAVSSFRVMCGSVY